MSVKTEKKPVQKNKKPVAARPVKKTGSAPKQVKRTPVRELTRAQKTAQARDAAAKRNAQIVSPVTKVASAPSKKPVARRTVPTKAQTKQQRQSASRQEINRKISSQTHAQRHEVKKSKKVSGSVKNLEIKRRTKTVNHSFRVKRKPVALRKLLLARLTLFFVIFALMFSLVAGLFSMRLKAGKPAASSEYTLQLGEDIPKDVDKKSIPEDQKPVYVEIPKEAAVKHGNLYIPVSALSDMCELTVTGAQSDLRYIPRGSDGHFMRFVVGSDIAYVNGAKVRMISPSFISDGKLYIPLDFMQKYSKGLNIEVDEVNCKIKMSKLLVSYDPETDSNIYSTLTFNLSATSPLTGIDELSIQE